MSINYRLNIVFWGLTLLMGLAIIFSFFTLDEQKIHGTEINIAGRQRMLTQKMAREAHAIVMGIVSSREHLARDADSFNTNHNALLRGGEVSLGEEKLFLKPTQAAQEGRLREQLRRVGALWVEFYKNVGVLIDKEAHPEAITLAGNYITINNSGLLQELEKVVRLFEIHAAEDVSRLKVWQISFLALAIFLNLTALFVLNRTIVRPVNALRDVTSRMAEGDLAERAPDLSDHEVGKLAASFNLMAGKLEESHSALEEKVAEKTEELRRQKEILEEAQRVARLGSWDWDMVNNRLTASDEFYHIIGMEPEGRNDLREMMREKIHPDDLETVIGSMNKALNNNEPYSIDYHIVKTDGTERVVHEENVVICNEDGQPIRMLRTVQDITELKRVEEQAYKLSRAVEQSPASVVITNVEGNIEYVNPRFTEVTGYTFEEALGQNPRLLKSGDQSPDFYKEMWDTLNSGKEWRGEFHNKKKNGEIFWESASISPVMNEKGEITNFVAVKEDISKRKESERELKKLSAAIEQSINMVFITDLNGNIEYVNAMFEEITGYSRDEVINKNLLESIATKISRSEYKALRENISNGKNWRGTYQSKRKNGNKFWVSTLTSPMKDEKGEVTHLISIQEDITKKKEADQRLEYLASYDSLTGLINRSRFMDLMNEWILFAEHANERGALLLIDMDNFTILNDIHGHNIGDEYLKSTAELLRATLQDTTTAKDGVIIGRMGSDEFAVLIPCIGLDEVSLIAESIRKSIEEHHVDQVDFNLTASVGIALYPEHGTTRQELFLKGDAAIQRAKELGQNVCHLYLPEDYYLEEMHLKYEWKRRILKAIKEDRFEIWAQPILDLYNDQIYHYEILVRMIDKNGSVVSPGAFISMAELFGLVGAIDRIVAEKAMKLLAERARAGAPISVSINLSGKDLEDDEILTFMQAQIYESGADPSSIHFEITETAAINDLERAIKLINSLKSMGCKFALDDFGVGFTSFVYLREMPVDYIKIDGSFIKNLHNSKNDQLFVKAITDVARGMGIKTIAEFVEEKETVDFLKEYGVDYGQGYYIGKPKPARDLNIEGETKYLSSSRAMSPIIHH
ncbi:MAG: EAL domain-containing protein [Proteobacteria bacterium]|nr:EAL domain-containing protein [Pseudomonadota bacterium]